MYRLPVLELEDIPLRLDSEGRLQPCRMNDEAVLANFAVVIEALSTENWQFDTIHIGTQELRDEQFRRFCQHFEAEKSGTIIDHIVEHLSDAKDDAAFMARNVA